MIEILENISLINLIFLSVFACAFLVQMIYYFAIYSRLIFHKKKTSQPSKTPVSVIICARNESENLIKYLPSVLTQDYANYEVIVVNDCSEDDSEFILKEYKEKFPHLKILTVNKDEKFSHGKKLAQTLGIKAAKNDSLLFTDADCEIKDNKWLSIMQENFSDKIDVVLGYGGCMRRKGFLDKLIRYDTFFIALQYLNYALAGFPYMGVGRNLAYKKSLFMKNKGFASHMYLNSGDDDLFVNEVANKQNVAVEVNASSFTRFEPKKTLKEWFMQKRRHLTSHSHYKIKHKILLGLEISSRMLFYSSIGVLLFLKVLPLYLLGFFLFRLLTQIIVIKITMKRLGEKYLLLSSLMFDVVMPVIYFYLSISNNKFQNRWK